MASDAQKAKMAVQLKQLVDDGVPLPQGFPGADTWKLVLIQHMKEQYGVTSRAELATKQASEVIDWLEAQAIPF
jgi:hypothetical protein